MSQEYLVGVLGGVSGVPSGKYHGIVTVMFADDDMLTVEARDGHDTAEEAKQAYIEHGGQELVNRYVDVLRQLSPNMQVGQLAAGSRVPICPLVDAKMFVTTARITQPYFVAAMSPISALLLQLLPPLNDTQISSVKKPKGPK